MEKTEIIKTIKDELTVIAECSVFHGQIESTTVITDSAIERIADRLVKNHSDLSHVSDQRELLISFMEYLSELTMDIDSYSQEELLFDFKRNL